MCNSDLEVAQLAERRTVVPQVGGAIPSFETLFCIEIIPNSLGGQDTRLSPVRPGFNSRSGNSFWQTVYAPCDKIKKLLPGFEPGSLDSKSRVLTITPQERCFCKLSCKAHTSRIFVLHQKVVPMGIEPMTLGLLDQCSTI